MGDKELLELAAKAVGINLHWLAGSPSQIHDHNFVTGWNPLNYDAEALSIVVKLGLHIGVCLDLPVGDCSYAKTDDDKNFIELHHKSNPAEATRRAIVRAAAEIGKTK